MSLDGLRKWQHLLPYVLLVFLAYLAYANTFANGWTYDDFPVIVENPDVRSISGFLANSYPGRPLRELTYLIDHAFFGLNPFGWHFQQIFWHALNACLVFKLARLLRISDWAAGLAALLFLLHPLQVEVVANLSHRKDSLALACSLATVICFLRFISAEKKHWGWLMAVIGFFGLALSAKQTSLVLPLVLLVYEILFLPKEKRILGRKPIVLYVLALVAFAIALYGWQALGGWQNQLQLMQECLSAKANFFEPVTWLIYYMTVLKSWVFMGLKLIVPVDLALEYTFTAATSFLDPWVIAGLLLLSGIALGLYLAFKHTPIAGWTLSSALLLFLPTANLWPLTYLAADRYLYAPVAFLSICIAALLTKVEAHRKIVYVPAAITLLLFVVLVWQQTQVWSNPGTLWQQAYKVSPTSSFALNNLGNLALQDGNAATAGDYYRKSAAVNPLNPTAHFNLGLLAENRGDLQTALSHYRKFASLNHPVYRKQLQALRTHLLRKYGVSL